MVVLDAPYMLPAFTYYAHQNWPVCPLPAIIPADSSNVYSQLSQCVAQRSQVDLLMWQDYYADPHSAVWTWLWQHLYMSDWRGYQGGIKVMEFDAAPATGFQPAGQVFGDALRLDGYQVAPEQTAGSLELRLFWHALKRPATNDAIAVHLLDPAGNDYGNDYGQPAGGHIPATALGPGEGLVTAEHLVLDPWTAAGNYRVQVLVHDPATLRPLATATSPAGSDVMVGVSVPPAATAATAAVLPTGSQPVGATFGSVATLSGYTVGATDGRMVLTLFWRAQGPSTSPLKVFVHALDDRGSLVASGDSDPVAGSAPATTWFAGEAIRDPHQLSVPASTTMASLEVGLYDPVTGTRVVATNPNGKRYANDAVPLALPAR
jgi:hypothetical protein